MLQVVFPAASVEQHVPIFLQAAPQQAGRAGLVVGTSAAHSAPVKASPATNISIPAIFMTFDSVYELWLSPVARPADKKVPIRI
jgi:hypothetical protein